MGEQQVDRHAWFFGFHGPIAGNFDEIVRVMGFIKTDLSVKFLKQRCNVQLYSILSEFIVCIGSFRLNEEIGRMR
jgi:hypothetical protein